MDSLLGILQPGDDAVVRSSGRSVVLVERVRNQPWVWLVEYPSGARRRFRAWELEGIRVAGPPEEPTSGYLGIYGSIRCSNDVRTRGVELPFGPADSRGIRDRYARWLDADGEEKEDLGRELAAIWAYLFVRERGSKAGCELETVEDIWLVQAVTCRAAGAGWELVAIWEDLFNDETGQNCRFEEVDDIWIE